jgi:hypothetical protein
MIRLSKQRREKPNNHYKYTQIMKGHPKINRYPSIAKLFMEWLPKNRVGLVSKSFHIMTLPDICEASEVTGHIF